MDNIMPFTQEDLDRAREIAEDKEWLSEVRDMLIADLERVNRAQAEELICLQGIVSN